MLGKHKFKILTPPPRTISTAYFPNLPTTDTLINEAIRSEFFSTSSRFSGSNCRRLAGPSPFFFLSFFLFFAKPIARTELCASRSEAALHLHARFCAHVARASTHPRQPDVCRIEVISIGGNGRYLTHLVADRRER